MLTIGFARRAAEYKRANLVFSDIDRLLEMGRGKVQFIFSGKAHPKDDGGKDLIREVIEELKEEFSKTMFGTLRTNLSLGKDFGSMEKIL